MVGANRRQNQAQEELDSFFNLSLDLLCIAGFDGFFKQLNPSWQKTLGFTLAALKTKPFLDFVHPEDRDSTIAAASKLSEENVNVVSFENRYLCSDGSYRWLLWNAAPSPTDALIYAAARDITERKEAEAKLKELNESLEERVAERTVLLEQRSADLARKNEELESFTYSVSHDLKEPLRTLEAFSQFLLEDYAERLDDEGKDYLERICKASIRMKRLIDDLLTLSRLSRRSADPTQVSMSDALEDIRAAMEASLDEKSATIEIAEGLPDVLADATRVEQIFANLISNGIKFNWSGHPMVKIRVESMEQGMATFRVEDNGIGIDPEYHERIFGLFQRLHAREDFEGTGAGLAIVKRAVETCGGSVRVESKLGAGSKFYVALPIWQATEQTNAVAA